MKDKFPEIYKRKINNLKTKVQKDYYYHADNKEDINEDIVKEEHVEENTDIKSKITDIFKRPNYIYQADVNIMYKNGKNKTEKVIGFKDDYLLLINGQKVHIDEIKDIK